MEPPKTEIVYKIGDLFDCVDWKTSSIKLIPHCCNNIGRFGSGFAGAVAQRQPHVQKRYFDWHRDCVDFESGKPFKLGQFQSVKLNPEFGARSYMLNMIGQNGVVGHDNPKPVKYGYLHQCIEDIGAMVQTMHDGLGYMNLEIVAPKFGSGLAKGDWSLIEEFINDSWINRGIKVTIFDLAQG